MNAWDDLAVIEAGKAIGRRTWVMAGIVTSVGLTYPALCALADGYAVCFIEDAVADITDPFHQAAVARLVRAGAVPRSTQALISVGPRRAGPAARARRGLLGPTRAEVDAGPPSRVRRNPLQRRSGRRVNGRFRTLNEMLRRTRWLTIEPSWMVTSWRRISATLRSRTVLPAVAATGAGRSLHESGLTPSRRRGRARPPGRARPRYRRRR